MRILCGRKLGKRRTNQRGREKRERKRENESERLVANAVGNHTTKHYFVDNRDDKDVVFVILMLLSAENRG